MAKSPPMNAEQIDVSLAFMESHDKLAARESIGLDPKLVKSKTLEKLVDQVKAKGPEKSGKQILDWWKNIRQQAKKYNAKKKSLAKATGNPANVQIKDNPIYDRVLRIVGSSHGNGLPLVEEIGNDENVKTESVNDQGNERPGVIVFNSKVVPSTSKIVENILNPMSIQQSNYISGDILQDIKNMPARKLKASKKEGANALYAQRFSEYATSYKKKPSIIEVRAANCMNLLTKGNDTMQVLTDVVQGLTESNKERNKLMLENNQLMRALLSKNNQENQNN